MTRLGDGRPDRLGAEVRDGGVNFAVWSRHATRIELCLFDESGRHEAARLALPARSDEVFHGFLPGAGAGLVYGLRAHGPWDPKAGHRFNPAKLLIDPYAREWVGAFVWHDAVYGDVREAGSATHSPNLQDSAPWVPKARVLGPTPRSVRPPKPARPWSETVVYEAHVKGLTAMHPAMPEALRGTVAGLAHPAVLDHLERLGVTAVELLPVAAWIDELPLVQRGQRNYWGYNPLGWFVMQPALAGPGGIAAMRAAVDALHERGIEVILDVVFNHSAEGDARGPTLSLRGLDNACYYLPEPDHPGGYLNLSGCGNTLAAHQPAVARLILDALRYWADEVGVDGFRFDLASALTRNARGEFDAGLDWIRALQHDPVLAGCKWIAESWDAHGSHVGGFPPGWVEWNDRFRDDLRRHALGAPVGVGAVATRLAGSSDRFGQPGRAPWASLNFITAHDGFSLVDLVSHSHRHNQANGEDNRDGHAGEVCDHSGVEGPSQDPTVRVRRLQRMRHLLALLMLARGVPMLRAGDEWGASQQGNNNAYCQDGPITWVPWPDGPHPAAAEIIDLSGLIAALARLRAEWACLRGEAFFSGHPIRPDTAQPDIRWLREDGLPMGPADWNDAGRQTLALELDAGQSGPEAVDDRVWIGLSAAETPVRFMLPPRPQNADTDPAQGWLRVLDSTDDQPDRPAPLDPTQPALTLNGPGMLVACAGTLASARRNRPVPPEPPALRCALPAVVARPQGAWVISLQVYSLHSAHTWGIGDFEALAAVAAEAASLGAAGLLVSPVHAPAATGLDEGSPYFPSSRLALNPLYISLPRAAEGLAAPRLRAWLAEPGVQAELQRLRRRALIDLPAVHALKKAALDALWQDLRAAEGHTPEAQARAAFEAWLQTEQPRLRGLLLHEVIAARCGSHRPHDWPEALARAEPSALAEIEGQETEALQRIAFAQWLADRQWQAAGEAARRAGAPLGLLADLAVGSNPEGADAWSAQDLIDPHHEIGAPPDPLGPEGQAWGLPPWRPARLRATDGAPFAALLRACLRGAGGLRIDHVMALDRLYWVPRSAPPAQGRYVDYPLQTLLEQVCRESQRSQALVIGEDLGTVRPGLRERLARARVLSYKVAWFERNAQGELIAPDALPPLSAVCASTHDLPTIDGWAAGRDLDERRALGRISTEEARALRAEREADLKRIEAGLQKAGIEGGELCDRLHRWLAASSARLAIVQLEDVTGLVRQPNLPGTPDVAPNWRQRLPVAVEGLGGLPRWQALGAWFAGRRA